jgi:O-acetyl-ADP-ribose deacetylase
VRWVLKTGNIVDESVDVLICSANVSLNLSGGVGAELLGRFGPAMQQALHRFLQARTPHCAERGEVITYVDASLPYKAVFHAVAVNGWYESSAKIVTAVVEKCLVEAQKYFAKSIGLTALATGFGNLTLKDFGEGILPLMTKPFAPIEEVRICLMEDYRIKELSGYLPQAIVIK